MKTFWNYHKHDFHVLASVAHDYLAIPATSTDSERLYSLMSNIITKKRASLHPVTISALAFCNMNQK